jgi:hypothetical protein
MDAGLLPSSGGSDDDTDGSGDEEELDEVEMPVAMEAAGDDE